MSQHIVILGVLSIKKKEYVKVHAFKCIRKM